MPRFTCKTKVRSAICMGWMRCSALERAGLEDEIQGVEVSPRAYIRP